MTLKDYMVGLQKLIEETPEALEYEVIHSHTDEGNEFQKVHSNGTIVEVEDLDARYLKLVWAEDMQDKSGKPNAVIIN